MPEDEHWRAGMFYVNRDDPRLLVPRRSGLGWTVNFGHPAGWAVLTLLLAIPVAGVLAGALAH
ncbi:hypothetical protein JIG36_40700 [Actinoplanes sp. LDG1-06]|uniref:DUF5808 domain-containing protein n=1 Tax=Paractinoplanes ovalisporus TaxID=2810368 RepID=A0ABS2AQ07_9ACTN|nr:DUF5808 domain-containing protein [Actinoplanes ovalisporus]MBM2621843.1 hypothetical protein [Actinoplanes ovalisporus]